MTATDEDRAPPRVMILLGRGWDDEAIAAETGCRAARVALWRVRWRDGGGRTRGRLEAVPARRAVFAIRGVWCEGTRDSAPSPARGRVGPS